MEHGAKLSHLLLLRSQLSLCEEPVLLPIMLLPVAEVPLEAEEAEEVLLPVEEVPLVPEEAEVVCKIFM
jgi:hypothetical protein